MTPWSWTIESQWPYDMENRCNAITHHGKDPMQTAGFLAGSVE
jgi:hypothetical protein